MKATDKRHREEASGLSCQTSIHISTTFGRHETVVLHSSALLDHEMLMMCAQSRQPFGWPSSRTAPPHQLSPRE